MGYSAGTLDLSILGASDSAVASIDKTVKALNSLSRAINKFNDVRVVPAVERIDLLFSNLARSTNKINSANLESLASAAKSLSAISKIGNLQNVDFTKVASGFGTLTTAISPFIAKVKEAEASLTALYGILSKSSSKKIGNLLNGSDSDSSSKRKGLSSFLNIGKWTAVFYAARRLGGVFANIAQKGADFSETLNLWQVSMGQEFLPQATKFVNKLNEAYGISKETLMNSQAIFKNMLGSLGQISEQSAYALSEGITQMALDYASLYNVNFESAMTKFQAALARQVRPIRSVSGYDITENTLFQLYQQLGGEKTMRQLSSTEKQLLAIYAVFQQMERSGARGDLARTLGSFANQSRIASENFKEILTYSGLIFTRWVQTTNLFQRFNGFLIFIGDVLESVANTLPDIEVPDDPMADMAENAEQTNKEIDELKGKLLGFDKFRSLNPTQNGDMGMDIDQTLIDAFTKYSTIFDNIDETSKKFAENLKLASGLFDENGVFNKERWDEITDSIENVGVAIGIVFGVKTIEKIINFADSLKDAKKKADLLKGAIDLLNTAIVSGALYAFYKAIEAFKEGKITTGITATAIGVTLVGAFLLLKTVLIDGKLYLDLFGKTLNATFLAPLAGIALLTAGISSLVGAWDDMGGWQKAITIITALTAAIIGAVVAVKAFSLSIPVALGLGAALAGGVLLIGSQLASNSVTKFANGGLPDKGTMFVAGEAGAEMVYNTPSGQSGVANVQQIAQATYSGTMRALNDWWGGSQAKGDIPQLKEANATGLYQAVTGVAKSYGKVWANV